MAGDGWRFCPKRESVMSPLQQASVRNRLLAALTPDEFWLLQPHLEPVPLGLRQWVIETQQPIQHVYFPEDSIISLLADTSQGRIEVGLIGPEGMAGRAGGAWDRAQPARLHGPG